MAKWRLPGIDETAYQALTAGLAPSQVWSLLLDVCSARAQRSPAALVKQFEDDGYVQPSAVDARALMQVDGHLFAAAADFEAVELAPLAPLGACSSVGLASQNKIVSALRGTEVVSDPTNVLALAAASRLAKDANAVVRLAASHRCVRAQPIRDKPGFRRHFRMFCLATAGREQQDHAFVVGALAEQIRTILAALARMKEHGYRLPEFEVKLLATEARAALAPHIAAELPGVHVVHERLEHPYYDGGLRYMIAARDATDGFPLADGGTFTWLAKLTSNRRLVFAASGIGAELIAGLFAP